MAKEVDPQEVLHRFVDRYPTQKGAAAALGISAPYLFDLLAGNRTISENVLEKLGLARVVVRKAS